jgi:hypothetical protein
LSDFAVDSTSFFYFARATKAKCVNVIELLDLSCKLSNEDLVVVIAVAEFSFCGLFSFCFEYVCAGLYKLFRLGVMTKFKTSKTCSELGLLKFGFNIDDF